MVYLYLTTGFEEVEALTCVDVLRRAAIDVQTVSMIGKKEVVGAHDIPVIADLLFEDSQPEHAKMLVLPGGPGARELLNYDKLLEQIKQFNKDGKNIAAICAAPTVFNEIGILSGKRATVYPGMEGQMEGSHLTGNRVTIDGNIVTGQGPGLAMDFALTLVSVLKDETTAEKIAKDLVHPWLALQNK